jgi:hypothetical protein
MFADDTTIYLCGRSYSRHSDVHVKWDFK